MTRVVLAMMMHETNTFSPVPTDLARFSKGAERPLEGAEILAAYRGTGSCTAGFIDVAEAAGAEIVPSIAASAPPSGPVRSAAYEYIRDAILEAVAGGCDAILLDLHGAMVTERHEDGGRGAARAHPENRAGRPDRGDPRHACQPLPGDGGECGRHRRLPDLPPHRLPRDRGAGRATDLRDAPGRGTGGHRLGEPADAAHVMRQGSGDFPNRELQARAREMEEEGALAVSLFTGFPHADISNAGLSCVVVTDGDRAAAERMRDELLDFAWTNREAFVYRIEPLADSIARAGGAAVAASDSGGDPVNRHPAAHGDGPVILLDHYDNAASGGTMDSMTVLRAILEAELEDVAVFAVHDPGAVRELIAAGVGAEATVMLGGKIDMPAINMAGAPLEVTGRVKLISEGRFRNLGPAGTGIEMNMGPTVVLDTGRVEIVVISRHHEPNDLNCFLSLGIDPRARRFLMLKSRIHYRAGFADVARDIIECAGTGVCTSDYDMLDFRNVRRPIYPSTASTNPDPLSQRMSKFFDSIVEFAGCGLIAT